jgi:hypothetical protein
MNPGGQLEYSDLYSHSKIIGLLYKFRICGPLSRNLRERENLEKDDENGRGEGGVGSLILFNRAIIRSQFFP